LRENAGNVFPDGCGEFLPVLAAIYSEQNRSSPSNDPANFTGSCRTAGEIVSNPAFLQFPGTRIIETIFDFSARPDTPGVLIDGSDNDDAAFGQNVIRRLRSAWTWACGPFCGSCFAYGEDGKNTNGQNEHNSTTLHFVTLFSPITRTFLKAYRQCPVISTRGGCRFFANLTFPRQLRTLEFFHRAGV
jgi:hypothetical protein